MKHIYHIKDTNLNLEWLNSTDSIFVKPEIIVELIPEAFNSSYRVGSVDAYEYVSDIDELYTRIRQQLVQQFSEHFVNTLKISEHKDTYSRDQIISLSANIATHDQVVEYEAKLKAYTKALEMSTRSLERVQSEHLKAINEVQNQLTELETIIKYGSLWTKLKLLFKGTR